MNLTPPHTNFIGPYAINNQLSRGDTTDTYLCLDPTDGRPVVVKHLQPEAMLSPAKKRMFEDEWKIGRALAAARTCEMIDQGEHQGRPYFVMSFVAGLTLVDVMRRVRPPRHIPYGVVMAIFRQVAETLHVIHHTQVEGELQGIVHRDVSLANIILGPTGQVTILDFGIAHTARRSPDHDPNILRGKLRYMAPEQFERVGIDHRVDVYQLGVSMYWLITGKSPFPSTGIMQQIAARVEKEPRDIRGLTPDCPPGLADLVMRCLRKDRGVRIQTAAHIVQALDELLQTTPSLAHSEEDLGAWLKLMLSDEEVLKFSPQAKLAAQPVDHRHSPAPFPAIPSLPRRLAKLPATQPDRPELATRSVVHAGLGLVLVAFLSVLLTVSLTPSLRHAVWRSVQAPSSPQSTHYLISEAGLALQQNQLAYAQSILTTIERHPALDSQTRHQLTKLQSHLAVRQALHHAHLSLGSHDEVGAAQDTDIHEPLNTTARPWVAKERHTAEN